MRGPFNIYVDDTGKQSLRPAVSGGGGPSRAVMQSLQSNVALALSNANAVWVSAQIPDVEVTNPIFVPAPVTGILSRIDICVVPNPGATLTISASIGGVEVTGGTVSIGGAEGNGMVKWSVCTANNAVAIHSSSVRLVSDGGGLVAGPAVILLGFLRT